MPRVLRLAAVRSPRCIFFWRDAAQRCGRHDKNDPLFGGFSSLWSLKIGIFPGRKKVSQGKPTEKRVVFIRAGKPCRPSSIQGAPADKGLASRLRLDNASLHPQLAQLIQSVAVRLDPCRRALFEGLCFASSVCSLGFVARRSLARASLLGFSAACCRFFRPNVQNIPVRGTSGSAFGPYRAV